MNNISHYQILAAKIQTWAKDMGFQQMGISHADMDSEKAHLQAWLDANYHGSMSWMEEHKDLRLHPSTLVPGATRVISVRMNYLPPETQQIKVLKSPDKAYVSRYALGRDYHKLIRKKLAKICSQIEAYCREHEFECELSQRPFVDSAPVLERPFAQKAGLGWVGKHTLLINEHAGSWFFLGEIYTNLPLPVNENKAENKCGDCTACLQVCPTDAFPQPYVLDARRCISYLTIENKGPIPEHYREVMGNRVFGCDDCQAICPWNKYADFTEEKDFHPRHQLDSTDLVDLFSWNEQEFLDRTAGSPIRRIGFQNWLRNISVGIGNSPQSPTAVRSLEERLAQEKEEWLREHFMWALAEQKSPPRRRKRKLKRS